MTTDNFTEAARAEAGRRVPLDGGEPDLIFRDRRELVEMAEWTRDHLAAQEPTPADSKISGYDLAVLRSTYQAFGTRDSEWGEGAQAGMRAAAAILGITIDEEDDL